LQSVHKVVGKHFRHWKEREMVVASPFINI
jgi:hypothetical protein